MNNTSLSLSFIYFLSSEYTAIGTNGQHISFSLVNIIGHYLLRTSPKTPKAVVIVSIRHT